MLHNYSLKNKIKVIVVEVVREQYAHVSFIVYEWTSFAQENVKNTENIVKCNTKTFIFFVSSTSHWNECLWVYQVTIILYFLCVSGNCFLHHISSESYRVLVLANKRVVWTNKLCMKWFIGSHNDPVYPLLWNILDGFFENGMPNK